LPSWLTPLQSTPYFHPVALALVLLVCSYRFVGHTHHSVGHG